MQKISISNIVFCKVQLLANIMLVFVVLKRVKGSNTVTLHHNQPFSELKQYRSVTRQDWLQRSHYICCLACFMQLSVGTTLTYYNSFWTNIQNSKTGSVELETGSAGPETWHHVQRAQTRAKRTQPSSASARRKQREIWWTSTAENAFFFSLPCWTRRTMNMRLILSAFDLYNEQNKPQRERGRTRAQWKRYWTLLSELAAHTANRPRFVVKKTEIHTSYPMKKQAKRKNRNNMPVMTSTSPCIVDKCQTNTSAVRQI